MLRPYVYLWRLLFFIMLRPCVYLQRLFLCFLIFIDVQNSVNMIRHHDKRIE